MRMDKIVCNCYNISIGDMAKAVEDGAKSFEEIQDATEVSLCCGSCEEYARNVSEELLKEGEV